MRRCARHRTPRRSPTDAREFGASLWIFDTAADGFGGNQNDMGHARLFVQRLNAVARHIGGGVLLIAHPSRAGMNDGSGSSGSVQWDAAVRSRLYLDFPDKDGGDTDGRILTRIKSNYAARGDTIELRWSRGAFVAEGGAQRPDAATVFLTLLDRMTEEKQWLSNNARAGNYAPRLFVSRPERQGYRRGDFERAMQALFAMHEIEMEEYRNAERKLATRLARVHDVPF
jgi:RecA-family ATPase